MRVEYLYWAMIFFSLVSLVLIVSMAVIVLSKKNIIKKRSIITGQLEDWVMDVALENNSGANHVFLVPMNTELLLKGRLAGKVLLRLLIKLKKSLSGKSGENLGTIYNQLNLEQISLKRLQGKLWHVKAKGIQELAIMNQHAYHEQIFELAQHKDPMVRMEAQTAMVRLQGYKGLQFFDQLTYPISEWHQVNLLHLLANQPITGDSGIFNWLNSPNATLVQFSLKLIGEQHAAEFQDEVIKCLVHPNAIVRMQAILCLGQIASDSAAPELRKHYIAEPDKNLQLCIINEFMKMGSQHDLPFLQNLQHAADADIKLAADKTVLYLQKKI
ncbi:MAG: HEAT repeat domain-containing protein [Ferruginibacter sp.]|nr:HEAT repeat domain-containing protein [Ferruginibacter sp.]